MKRNLIASIELSRRIIRFNVLEKLNQDIVEIFSATASMKDYQTFIKTSLAKISALIGGQIKTVGIVIEPSEQLQGKVFTYEQTFPIPDELITYNTIKQIKHDLKHQLNDVLRPKNLAIAFVSPFEYELIQTSDTSLNQTYTKVPVLKRAKAIKVKAAITSMSTEALDFVRRLAEQNNFTIGQVLIKPQVLAQAQISARLLEEGAIQLHVADEQTTITFNQHNVTKAYFCLYQFGFNNLINAITKVFACSPDEANKLLAAYASTDDEPRRTIYTSQFNVSQSSFDNQWLKKIVTEFLDKIYLYLERFIDRYQIEASDLILSGKLGIINGISDFTKTRFGTTNVQVYHPAAFVEVNEHNLGTLGLINLIDHNKVQRFDTIVNTNPELITTFKDKPKDVNNWLMKFFTKKLQHLKGEKYD